MDNFGAALAAISELKRDGVIAEYAVGGAMAHAFWSEPTPTFDLDVFVSLESAGMLTDLGPIYRWAESRGYAAVAWIVPCSPIWSSAINSNCQANENRKRSGRHPATARRQT